MADELNSYKDLAILSRKTDAKIAQEVEQNGTREINLSPKLLGMTYLVIVVGFILFLPTIYIKNQIYYYSRDISVLWDEYSILTEENRDLRQNMETMRFKREVLDVIEVDDEYR